MKIKKIELNLKSKINPLKEKALSHVKSSFFRDSAVQLLLILIAALFIAAWVLAIYYFRVGSYLVPLRYSSFLGFFELGRWYQSYEMIVFFTLCVFLNIILGNVVYKKDKFLAYIVVSSNIFIALVVITLVVNFGRTII